MLQSYKFFPVTPCICRCNTLFVFLSINPDFCIISLFNQAAGTLEGLLISSPLTFETPLVNGDMVISYKS